MREIKFRIWDKANNRYMPNPGLIILSLSGRQLWTLCGQHLNEDDYILEQFTGLFDKEDKEIYEGDIVKNYQADENEVYMCEGQWSISNWHAGALPLYGYDNVIVGNIHENPEEKPCL